MLTNPSSNIQLSPDSRISVLWSLLKFNGLTSTWVELLTKQALPRCHRKDSLKYGLKNLFSLPQKNELKLSPRDFVWLERWGFLMGISFDFQKLNAKPSELLKNGRFKQWGVCFTSNPKSLENHRTAQIFANCERPNSYETPYKGLWNLVMPQLS